MSCISTKKAIRLFCLLSFLLIVNKSSLTAQTFAWAKQIGGINSSTTTAMGVINNDPFGNMYLSVSGSATIDVDPGANVVNTSGGIVKFDPSGNFLWVKSISSNMAFDASGNIYTTGKFTGTTDLDPGPGVYNLTSFGYEDVYIARYDPNGNLTWAKQIGGAYQEVSSGIAVSPAGRIYVGGSFGYGGTLSPINSCDFDPDPVNSYTLTNVGSRDGFILSLDLNGQFIAVSQKGTAVSETIWTLRCDNTGNIIYVLTDSVIRLQKADADFNLIWSIDVFNVGMNMAPFTLDAANNILISGGYIGTSDFDPGPGVAMVPSVTVGGTIVQAPFVEKFDANGNFMWVKTIPANGFANGVTTDAAGNVYCVGHFNNNGNVDFDPGPGVYTFKVSALAGYVQKLSPVGNFLWAAKVGGESRTNTRGRAITVNNSNEVFTALEFSGTIDADPGTGKFTMKPKGSQDVMFHRMTQSIPPSQKSADITVSEPKLINEIRAYPNPSKGNFYIDVPVVGEDAKLEIYSMSGQLILRRSFNGKNEQRLFINKEFNTSGIYLLQVTGKDKKFNTRIAVQ